jgi:uncharacterized phage protein (TIGR01671 family)
MREILFRGKRKVCDEWVFGFPFISRKGEYKIKWYDPYYGSSKTSEIYPESIGQFTGLFDKNKNKIFEGDIIEWNAKEFGREYRELVKWDFGLLGFRQGDWGEWCKVIGNIHDNPELFGGADNA